MRLDNEGATLEVEGFNKSIRVAVYDRGNLCADNNYNGDSAVIEITHRQAKELVAFVLGIIGD